MLYIYIIYSKLYKIKEQTRHAEGKTLSQLLEPLNRQPTTTININMYIYAFIWNNILK